MWPLLWTRAAAYSPASSARSKHWARRWLSPTAITKLDAGKAREFLRSTDHRTFAERNASS